MNTLHRRLAALEARKANGKPAYVLVWEDNDQATVERAIAKRRAEQPEASEIIAIAWGRPQP